MYFSGTLYWFIYWRKFSFKVILQANAKLEAWKNRTEMDDTPKFENMGVQKKIISGYKHEQSVFMQTQFFLKLG